MTNEIVWKVGEEERSCLTEEERRTERVESVHEAKRCEGEKNGSVNRGRGGGGSRGKETLLLYPDVSEVFY